MVSAVLNRNNLQLKTCRAQFDRALDTKSGIVTLSTLQKAANAMGKTPYASLN